MFWMLREFCCTATVESRLTIDGAECWAIKAVIDGYEC